MDMPNRFVVFGLSVWQGTSELRITLKAGKSRLCAFIIFLMIELGFKLEKYKVTVGLSVTITLRATLLQPPPHAQACK